MPREIEITNAQRAEWAKAAVEAYRAARDKGIGEAIPAADLCKDLLVDVMHLLRAESEDPIREVATALGHYATERQADMG